MTQTSPVETVLDRRQLRRKLTRWRLVAVGLAVIAILVAVGRFGGDVGSLTPHIARIEISGLITGDRDTLKLIKSIDESKATAVLVQVSSPGGTVTGSEHIFDELRRIAQKRPVVAVVDTMAASGGYIVALGADHIVADGNSLIGSIGVLFQIPNVSKLLDTVGVKVETIKSSPLKAAPNGLEPTSDAARAAIDALVVDSYSWFKTVVKERRTLNDAQLAAVSDGRVFTGRQGMDLKLIDEFGGEREAVAWLERERGVAKGLPVKEYKKSTVGKPFNLFSAAASIAGLAGGEHFERLASQIENVQGQAGLDGLLAIWHVGRDQ
ncbi:signal peptide peptidase SppA [Rhodoblastus sphagnicola]|uniref:Signal peptide peptidase SppA n=1 Tax=Rhodoblastus sphagnicola TaxID=333368 RepID=A0A2S6NBY1_9HYPH|nr:signal peptide peptidase SppA [Rhodoblastus sphagnicola]MBB4198714.1 protease-4 [Rhodoblastus sphagnicola]PPQ32104.1 signal peptide peptidase SppA [Rhodoblastus sphagnicola]